MLADTRCYLSAESPGFGPSVEFWGAREGGMGKDCAALPLACSPFHLLKSLMSCSVSLGLSPSFQGISALPGCRELFTPSAARALQEPKSLCLGILSQKGSFPSPSVTELLTAVSALGRFSFSLFQPKLCICKTCSSSLPCNFSGVVCPKLLPVNEEGAVASSALPHMLQM